MSRAEVDVPAEAGTTETETAVRAARPLWTLGLFRDELRTTFRRWRTLALLGVLAAVPVLVGIAVRIETGDGSSSGGGGDPRSSRRSPTTACSSSSPRSPRPCRSSCPWRSG